jgi:hypothetical protein
MKSLLLFLAALLFAPSAVAQPKTSAKPVTPVQANGPKLIGKFDDWRAATHVEAGDTVCYAFTNATSSVPATTGRGTVTLTITQRSPTARDQVAISAGLTYATNATVMAQADKTALEFYTAQRSAFARDGRAAVLAFQKAAQVLAREPNPKGGTITDQFSLKGFTKAYDAINKACPAK